MGSLYGYEIECDRPLSRLSEAPAELGRITVGEEQGRPLEAEAELTRLITDDDLRPSYAAARLDGRVLTWHSDAGTYVGDPRSMQISHRPGDTTLASGAARWEDRLASTAIPLLLGERGGVSLHAAANLVGDRAVVICGVTGRGKSTLSAALAAAGNPSMGEDGVVLHRSKDGFVAWPGARGSLITDAAADRLGLAADAPVDARERRLREAVPCGRGPARVGAVVFLRERGGRTVELERVGTAKVHRELIDHLLLAGRMGPAKFAAAARLAAAVDGALLRLPDSLDSLEEAAELLVRLADPA